MRIDTYKTCIQMHTLPQFPQKSPKNTADDIAPELPVDESPEGVAALEKIRLRRTSDDDKTPVSERTIDGDEITKGGMEGGGLILSVFWE